MAKGIGNGVPLGAMTTRPEIAEVMANRIHFNTFGGNPVSMIQGLATLEVIDEENIQQNALEVGNHLQQALSELQQKHDLIGEVRGLGLMLGVELVRDRKTKEPAHDGNGRCVGVGQRTWAAVGQGWIVRQHFADQAADVHHQG